MSFLSIVAFELLGVMKHLCADGCETRLADVVLIRRICDGSKNGCNQNDYQQLDKREALLMFHCIYVVNN